MHMDTPVEGVDALNDCNDAGQEYSTDLTDVESDEKECISSPGVLERPISRSFKRTYGAILASGVLQKRRLRSRIHEQFQVLREALPDSCTDEKASILKSAYEYIVQLHRRVHELRSELDADEHSCEDYWSSSCGGEKEQRNTNDATESGYMSCFGSALPSVEVWRTGRRLKIHVECDESLSLLPRIMELLEFSGLDMEQTSIECVQHLVLDYIGLEAESDDLTDSRAKPHLSAAHLGSSLVSLIAKQRDDALS